MQESGKPQTPISELLRRVECTYICLTSQKLAQNISGLRGRFNENMRRLEERTAHESKSATAAKQDAGHVTVSAVGVTSSPHDACPTAAGAAAVKYGVLERSRGGIRT